MTPVRIILTFDIVDREAFKTALNVAVDAAWQELPSTEAEQIETVVTNMDRIALAYGYPLGWLDVGLERVTS